MSEENKPQIIIHKSNWAKQLIIAVVVLVFFFFAIGKNPSKSDFIQACIKEYLKKEQSFGSSTSNYVSDVSTGIFGSWFEPLIERGDFLIFSKFNVEIDNDEFKMKINAIGFWDNIIFSDVVMEKKEPVQIQEANSLEDFKYWLDSQNVTDYTVTGPDEVGLFELKKDGVSYFYIWEDGEWVYLED
jgi:hypothetical protein